MTTSTDLAFKDLTRAARSDELVPPAPPAPSDLPPLHRLLGVFGANAILAWPAAAYDENIIVRRVGGRRIALVSDPRVIRHVFVENAANYRLPLAQSRVLGPILGYRSLILLEGEAWRHSRRVYTPCFARQMLDGFAPLMAGKTDQILAQLATDDPQDLFSIMERLTLEIAGHCLFSLDLHKHQDTIHSFRRTYNQRLRSGAGALDILLPGWLMSPKERSLRRLGRRWFALIDHLIAAHDERQQKADDDLLDTVRKITDPDSGAPIDDAQVRDHVASMILVGHETTALTLFWACYLLARAEHIQEAVAQEASRVDATGATTTAGLARLTMTRAVIDEALRLYPPIHTIGRQALRADRIGALPLPKRSVVLLSTWVLHRHRRHWREPSLFDPARFLPGAKTVERFAYLPFGIGPRTCIGAQFALMEATLILAKVLQRYRITLQDRVETQPVATVTTRPDPVPKFRFHRR